MLKDKLTSSMKIIVQNKITHPNLQVCIKKVFVILFFCQHIYNCNVVTQGYCLAATLFFFSFPFIIKIIFFSCPQEPK